MSVCCPAVLLSAEWIVSCTRITCIQPLSRCSLTFLASSFFSESVVVVVFLSFPLLFHHAFFFLSFFLFISGLLAISYPLVFVGAQASRACPIRAAILHFSFRLHLFTSRCFVIGSVLISDLLYQSASFIFLDGSRVSEGLVRVS